MTRARLFAWPGNEAFTRRLAAAVRGGTGRLRLHRFPDGETRVRFASDVRGRDVVLVDDILESGRTLAYAKDLFAARGARRVLTCVLLEKPGKRAVSLHADFVGFICPDLFVVGYGMDVAHAFRQLPFVGVVEKN